MRRYTLTVKGREFVVDVQELSADSFEVSLGDQTFEVQLSDMADLSEALISPQIVPLQAGAGHSATRASAAAPTNGNGAGPKAAPTVAAPPAPRSAGRPSVGGKAVLNAPMPGVILEVSASIGDPVVRGQVVAVLEAMKMKNAIKSPRDGVVAEVYVQEGQAVGHGDPLVRFEES